MTFRPSLSLASWGLLTACCLGRIAQPCGPAVRTVHRRTYDNRLTPLADPAPLLADHPEFVEPVRETRRYEAPLLVDDADADLHVRAWRF